MEMTEPMVFSADETCDVGNEFGSPVNLRLSDAEKVQRRGELG